MTRPTRAAQTSQLDVPQQRRGNASQLRRGRSSWLYRAPLRFGVGPFLVAADIACLEIASVLRDLTPLALLALVSVTLVLLSGAGHYRSRLEMSLLQDGPSLVWRTAAGGAFVVSGALLLGIARIPQVEVLRASLLAAVMLMPMRAAAYFVVRRLRSMQVVEHPTLVLGAGRVGGQVVSTLQEHPEFGLRPVGFLDGSPLLAPDQRGVPVLGSVDDLATAIVEFDIRAVVVAYGSTRESEMVDVIRTCDHMSVDVFTVPRLYELHRRERHDDEAWGVPLLRMRRAAFRRPSWKLKRALDVVVGLGALVALFPVLAALALAVRLDGGRGVFFRQERVGLDGRPFQVLKFRSMRPVDADESQTTWSIAQDSRVSSLGRFLRKSSLDELPQLWNVVRGDMTLVGPRPERPHFVEKFAEVYPRYDARHRVPAGVTGWAQIHGLRGDTSIADRARFDNYYIENWSLWYDVKILLRTFGAVLRRPGS